MTFNWLAFFTVIGVAFGVAGIIAGVHWVEARFGAPAKGATFFVAVILAYAVLMGFATR